MIFLGKKKIKQHKPKYTFCGYNKGENRGFGDKYVKDQRKRGGQAYILSVFFWKKTEKFYEEEKKKPESGMVRDSWDQLGSDQQSKKDFPLQDKVKRRDTDYC